ncbi:type I-E CRISPR-associated protein Cas6/Cse3/CasE [Streptomyces sp. CB02923]
MSSCSRSLASRNQGIGRGKAYGCGLLGIAPARSDA